MATATYTDLKNSIINRINTEHLPMVEVGEEIRSVEITDNTVDKINQLMTQELTVDLDQMEELFESFDLKSDLTEWVESQPVDLITTGLDEQSMTTAVVPAALSLDENCTLTFDSSQHFLNEFIEHWAEEVAGYYHLRFKEKAGEMVIDNWESRDAYIISLLKR